VVNGELYHGAAPGEVELGHIRLERDGTIVEDRCAGWGVDRRIRREVANAPESELARLLQGKPEGGEAKQLGAALAAGDPLAQSILNESMREYAFALSHAVHIVHPEIIVLGGGLSLIGERMRAAVAESLNGFLMDAFLPGPKVVLSALGEDVVPVGALALAAQRLGRLA
jgi:glucokinase